MISMLAILVIGAALFVGLSLHSARRPGTLIYLLLFVQFLVAGRLMPQISVGVLGIGLGPVDVVNVLALTVAILRMPRGATRLQWLIISGIGLVIYGTLAGFLQLGGAAALGFRAELYFLVPALFVSTLDTRDLTVFIRGVVHFGMALVVLAGLRWVGIVPVDLGFTGGFAFDRVIPSNAALWVAMASTAGLLMLLRGDAERVTRFPWVVMGLCLVVVVLTQHRTVWLATIVMMAALFVSSNSRPVLKVGMGMAAVMLVLLVESLSLGGGPEVAESLAFAATDAGTWQWRLERWADVWTTHAARGPMAILFGSGYGYGWVTGAVGEWEVSPHNGYLQLAVRVGLLGAFLIFLPYAHALKRLRRSTLPSGRLLWFWTIGVLIYYIPYAGDMLTGMVLGGAIAALSAERAGAPVSSPPKWPTSSPEEHTIHLQHAT